MATIRDRVTKSDHQHLADARLKYFIQMLDVKCDMNMTRVYSVIKNSDFLNRPTR